jgi:hypothetical protein
MGPRFFVASAGEGFPICTGWLGYEDLLSAGSLAGSIYSRCLELKCSFPDGTVNFLNRSQEGWSWNKLRQSRVFTIVWV